MTISRALTRDGLRRLRAREVIRNHTLMTAASAAAPPGMVSAAVAMAVQLRMAQRLCLLFGAPFTQELAVQVITGLVQAMEPPRLGTQVLRLASIASWFTGPLTCAGINAAYTWAIGEALLEQLATHSSLGMPPASPGLPA
ncbi:hypothetical protein DR66_2000 [Delftia acidovorans]|uniref:hypothetical protein n=1 Tax=Delftia acidovorans TaxID=80866 RepID=UPI0005033185|nr:hypothetical protein [Delftia acidovorans]KFJ09091.1 hypothetical protein DR66_2000 [Delftia acidovorans]QQB52220.1 hypothetical protein I6H54_08170 [Delftia acidovorans]